jgi:hypothetical protein
MTIHDHPATLMRAHAAEGTNLKTQAQVCRRGSWLLSG